MPFAGEYLIGGRNFRKNRYLGTTTPEHAAGYVTMAIPEQDTLVLREGETMDLSEEKYESYKHYAYPYENVILPSDETLFHLVDKATERLREKQKSLNCYPDCLVVVNGIYLNLNLNRNGTPSNILRATLPPELLYQILIGYAHWNNAEIGCHIEFERTPNVYLPDVHLLMSYFHA